MTYDLKALLKRARHEENCEAALAEVVGAVLLGEKNLYPPEYMVNLRDAVLLLQRAFPEWFILRLGEFRNPIVYRDDTHSVRVDAHMRCVCELQHLRGGLLTCAYAPTLPRALVAAMLTVKMREER